MKVEVSARTSRNADRIDTWWREHRDARDLFAREFQKAVRFLETVPNPGTPWPTKRRPGLRRLLLKKTKRHIYFEIFEPERHAEASMTWDPKLRCQHVASGGFKFHVASRTVKALSV